jgi:hypothetical protein
MSALQYGSIASWSPTREVGMRRTTIIFVLAAIVFTFATDAAAQRTIKPVPTPKDLLLTPATVWITATKLPEPQGAMVHSSYVAGFFDAVALFELNSSKMGGVSAALEGMDFAQVIDSVTKFYRENPQWRDWHPALVITAVLPRIRKGLPPVPPEGIAND